jgi:hypothetical protein
MAAQKRQLTGLLRKPIDLADVKAQDLRAVLALLPDENDILEHHRRELCARVAELDKFFGLQSDSQEEQRAKALVEYLFKVDANDPQWWLSFTAYLLRHHVPGFSIKRTGKKKHGAPRTWTDERFCQLFADVEYLKKTTGMNVGDICKQLPRRKGYGKRWGLDTPEGLRKAYTEANKRSRTVLFQMELCGRTATDSKSRIDHIEAAIERHALEA